ncbi:hypothetical protein [Legionella septentrionalis]|uniref:hypothetical protein n=1 Tax=Legionella septentrionalis TaxID=2498109 RepID=UPI000F8EC931|nr:hypothetical protein [Legionella septentrionalis]RUR17573.1 hypothetical protein ELY10_01175 [Legionella septentrionalis]
MTTTKIALTHALLRDILLRELGQLRKIEFAVSSLDANPANWNQAVKKIISEYTERLRFADKPARLFRAAAEIEQKIYSLLNQVLEGLSVKAPLKKVGNKLDVLQHMNESMINLTLRLAPLVPGAIQEAAQSSSNGVWQRLQSIANHIQYDVAKTPAAFQQNPAALVNMKHLYHTTQSLILFTLAKEAHTRHGQFLIEALEAGFKNYPLQLSAVFSFPRKADIGVASLNLPAFLQVERQLIEASSPLEQHLAQQKNKKTASLFMIPIALPVEYQDLQQAPAYIAMREKPLHILSDLLKGSFVFDEKGACFVPFHVRLCHEFLHVVRKLPGSPARTIHLDAIEGPVWSAYEDYLTIMGIMSEVQFSAAYGVRQRESHDGIRADILFDKKERSPNVSMAALTKKHTPKQPLLLADCEDFKTHSLFYETDDKKYNLH